MFFSLLDIPGYCILERREAEKRSTEDRDSVGRSDRVGTTEGIATDEVLVTTTTVTKEVFRGGEPNPKQLLSSVTGQPQVEEVLQNTTEVSRILQNTTEVSRELVNTDVQREVVDTTFTVTGKCKNVPGPQPRTGG